jgi:mono/diheme cytochrome c family protein
MHSSKPLAFLAAGAIAALIATGCSNNKGGSDQTTTSTTTTTSTSQPIAEATSQAGAGAAATAAATTGTTTTTTTTTTSGGASPAAEASGGASPAAEASGAATQTGDPAKGKQIFAANCASCHGATGTEGGVGPSLKNEKSRKNYAQAIAWIENPQPPMPKLYPSPLSLQDVQNVAAYVETL